MIRKVFGVVKYTIITDWLWQKCMCANPNERTDCALILLGHVC